VKETGFRLVLGIGVPQFSTRIGWAGRLVPAPVPLPARVGRRGVHADQRRRGRPSGCGVPRTTSLDMTLDFKNLIGF
jgi:hypothetical protein